jgi:hypothetical protein
MRAKSTRDEFEAKIEGFVGAQFRLGKVTAKGRSVNPMDRRVLFVQKTGLGAQAGEKRLADVFRKAGFQKFRRAKTTPFNLIFEAKPLGNNGTRFSDRSA